MKLKAPRAEHMTKMIGNFTGHGMHPYTVGEEGGFIDMVAFAMPDYSVPSRMTFSRAVIPDLYESENGKRRESCRKFSAEVRSVIPLQRMAGYRAPKTDTSV